MASFLQINSTNCHIIGNSGSIVVIQARCATITFVYFENKIQHISRVVNKWIWPNTNNLLFFIEFVSCHIPLT